MEGALSILIKSYWITLRKFLDAFYATNKTRRHRILIASKIMDKSI